MGLKKTREMVVVTLSGMMTVVMSWTVAVVLSTHLVCIGIELVTRGENHGAKGDGPKEDWSEYEKYNRSKQFDCWKLKAGLDWRR